MNTLLNPFGNQDKSPLEDPAQFIGLLGVGSESSHQFFNSSNAFNATALFAQIITHGITSIDIYSVAISLTSSMIQSLMTNNIFGAGLGIMFFTWLINFIRENIMDVYYRIKDLFFYSMEISQTDHTYGYIKTWLSSLDYSKSAKNVTVHAQWKHSSYDDDDYNDEPEILFVPGMGTHRFKYKGSIVWLTREDTNEKGESRGYNSERITLTIFGLNGKQVLQQVMQDAMQLHFKDDNAQTAIYSVSDDYCDWNKFTSKEIRPWESVFLPQEIKESLIQDVKRFLSNGKWYKSNGINFRRGYLLYGPPGTGKTSSILALAGQLNLSVCVLNLSRPNMTDNFLIQIMNKAPARSIILLEDIDAAFNERKAGEVSGNLTFSGLLNALDGVASQNHARMVFMTTNHIERLAPALIRPGRVDFRVKFGLATKAQIEGMFRKFYPEEKYVTVAKQLANAIPDEYISPAELQCFLIMNQMNPGDIVAGVPEYLKECEETRAQIAQKKKEEEEARKKEATEPEVTDKSKN